MLRTFAPLAIASILAATSASAGPAASSLLQLKSVMPADTMQVEDRGERRGEYRRERHHSYTPGRRYDRAPSHYHRHAHRPHNWRSRGCILVGPVWYCA